MEWASIYSDRTKRKLQKERWSYTRGDMVHRWHFKLVRVSGGVFSWLCHMAACWLHKPSPKWSKNFILNNKIYLPIFLCVLYIFTYSFLEVYILNISLLIPPLISTGPSVSPLSLKVPLPGSNNPLSPVRVGLPTGTWATHYRPPLKEKWLFLLGQPLNQ